MPRELSAAARAALFAQHTDECPVTLITVEHPALPAPLRLCDQPVNVISRGMEFVAFPFRIVLPTDLEDQPPTATLVLDNISREMTAWLRPLTTPALCLIEIVLASSPDVVEAQWPEMRFAQNRWPPGGATIEIELGLDDISTEPLAQNSFNPSTTPGIY